MPFQCYFSYITAASAPTHDFLELFLPVLITIFFPSYWQLSHITMNPVATRAITEHDHTSPPAHCHRAGFGHTMIIIIIIEWRFMPLLTVIQSYHGGSSHYSCLSWVSPVIGWGSEVSYPTTFPRKTQRIQCGSNPGPLDYESNTLPLSHAGPQSQNAEWFSKCRKH